MLLCVWQTGELQTRGGRTIHERIGEDHDRVVEVSVLLSDHAERRSLLLLRRLPGGDARRQVDDHHVCG